MLEPRSASGTSPSSAGDRRDVVERAAVERAAGRAVAALVEADRREPGRAGRAGEVVVALLAGARAVEDHHAGPRLGRAGSHSE